MFIDSAIVAAVKANFKPNFTIRTVNKILPGRQGSLFSDLHNFVYGTRPSIRFATFGEFKNELTKLEKLADSKINELVYEDIYHDALEARYR